MSIHVTLPFACVSSENDQTVLLIPTGDNGYSIPELELFDKAMKMFDGLDEKDREKVFDFARKLEVIKLVNNLMRVSLNKDDDIVNLEDDDIQSFASYNMQNTIDDDDDEWNDDNN